MDIKYGENEIDIELDGETSADAIKRGAVAAKGGRRPPSKTVNPGSPRGG
jgi:hypothetical protein